MKPCVVSLVGLLQVFFHLVWCWILLCIILLLLYLEMGFEFLIFPRRLMWRDVKFCQMIFQHLKKWSCVLVFFCFLEFVYVMDDVDGFLYIEQFLHPWDEPYLIMMYDRFEVFLNSVCEFYWTFYHQYSYGKTSKIFFVVSLCFLGISIILDS